MKIQIDTILKMINENEVSRDILKEKGDIKVLEALLKDRKYKIKNFKTIAFKTDLNEEDLLEDIKLDIEIMNFYM